MPTHGRDTELVEVYGQALPTGGGRSRNRHPAVHRIHMPGDHPRFLRSQEHRHVSDVLGLDQPHQMRRRELCHPRIAGHGRPTQPAALRLACRRYFRRLARTLGASRDGNGRFQLDEPLGDELRPIIRAFLSPLRT
jgi:hypothetical protein